MIMDLKKKVIVPDFLTKDFIFSHFEVVNINKIYVGLFNSNLGKIKYINIKKTYSMKKIFLLLIMLLFTLTNTYGKMTLE